MTVVIADEITRAWPTTERSLTDDSAVGYASHKLRAIARAKRDLYSSAAIPADEADIPDIAKYWIADKALTYLIPTARDWYMSKQRLSDGKEGASISYYNKLQALDKLKQELDASLLETGSDARESISASSADYLDAPAVSMSSGMIDPAVRAYRRGVPGGPDFPRWPPGLV